MTQSAPKKGQFGMRKPIASTAPGREFGRGKSMGEQSVGFDETVQLPGGVSPDRRYDRGYVASKRPPPLGSYLPIKP